MALQTDLNVSPYFDDFNEDKKYYKVLFKPSVAVQARELNTLQSILQNQIERFGDNIFKKGTVIEGCSIIFHPALPYVKVKDSESDGTPVNVNLYNGYYAKNSANLVAKIVEVVEGFETQNPNLNTLFVKYINSGNDSNTSTFSSNQTITIYSDSYPIFKYKVVDGSSGFSNSDTVVVISSLSVQNSTGGNTFPASSFVAGQTIQNGVANAIIVEANATVNSQALILKIRPLAADLISANTLKWTFNSSETIRNANTSNTANVVALIGVNAQGSLTTDSLGKIVSITTTNQGSGYYHQPYVSVSITSNGSTTSSEINQLDVTPFNYLTTVSIGTDAQQSIGTGYGVTINDGTVYQKGFFSKVDEQLIIVNKYSNTGFDKSVGFYTEEDIINSNEDTTLLDNASGTFNYTAPGADRLYLNPILRVLDKGDAEANTDFFPIVEFSEGIPYKKTNQTVYNVIGDELAKRTYEESGNYVLDEFNVTTKDSTTFANTANTFKVYIDPGLAYINGYRISTTGNFQESIDKGMDTLTGSTTSKFGIGSYLLVDELGGRFNIHKAAQVELYNTAVNYVTGGGGTIATAGTLIGYARIRSLMLESGDVGTSAGTYKLYVFDFDMVAGKNLSDVRSICFKDTGTPVGICDTVLDNSKTNLLGVGSDYTGLLIKTVNASKSVNDLEYVYRTVSSETANSTGYISKADPGATESYPYTGTWSAVQKSELILIPTGNYQADTLSGTIQTNSNTTVTGTSTDFTAQLKPGDFIRVTSASGNTMGQVSLITSNVSLKLVAAANGTVNGVGRILFPNNVPISLNRTGRTANVDVSNGHLTIYLANNISNVSTNAASTMGAYLTFNVKETDITPTAKSIKRNIYTRIVVSNTIATSVGAANSTANTVGPWALGIPEAFRLKTVYSANVASRTLTVNPNTAVSNTDDFISVANNLFSNGDSVLYANTTGNNVIGGLSNNTTYFVVSSNSSGFKLAATRGGAVIDLTANGTTGTSNHTLVGYPLFFNESSPHAVDVTNDYYVDHNQTEDFLDISFLFLKPRKSKPTANDSILVKFDAFTTGSGAKTVSSYSISDGANLTSLSSANTNIHTMEIPEVFGIRNAKYYDLRDQIDFRPSVANTIALTSDTGSNTNINPTGGDANTRIQDIDWKFPAPDTDVTANVEYYLGRNDLIAIQANGRFSTTKGGVGIYDKLPAAPSNSMTLQYLIIPPYPSLPASLSKEMAEIVDTKIVNEKYTKMRQSNFKVATSMDNDQKSKIQFKNYKMADIAKIERRIEALEYYTRFTLAETIAKSRFIPSAADGSDRFKFGYFVDPFSNDQFSDKANPEFWSLIKDECLQPIRNDFNINFDYEESNENFRGGQTLSTFEFENYAIISQLDITDGPVFIPVPVAEPEIAGDDFPIVTSEPTVVGPVTPTLSQPVVDTTGTVDVVTLTQVYSEVVQRNTTSSYNDNGTSFEEFYYTFSATEGPAKLFMNSRDNNAAIEISQSDTRDGTYTRVVTSAGASAISQYEFDTNGLYNITGRSGDWESLNTLSGSRKSNGPFGGWIEDSFKVTWTYDPSLGQFVRVRVYKGKRSGNDASRGSYYYKLVYPSDTTTRETITVPNPATFNYNGTVQSIAPNYFEMPNWTWWTWVGPNYFNNSSYAGQKGYVDNQKFTLFVSGLKPNTIHKFILEGQDQTSKTQQIRVNDSDGGYTSGLVSNNDGLLRFDFYYDAGIDEAASDWELQNKIASSVAGDKSFRLESYDLVSTATGAFNIKTWTTSEYTYNGTTYTIATNQQGEEIEYNYNNQSVPPVETETSTENNVITTVDYDYSVIEDENPYDRRYWSRNREDE